MVPATGRRHPKFVRSRRVLLADGRSIQVSDQLQTFKCAELALMAVSPGIHARVRRLYDVIGSRLARSIQHPVLADMAYLALKPFEWLTGFILKRLVPSEYAMSIYN